MRAITDKDWRRVLVAMLRHHRTEGFVDWVDGLGLAFFDSDPCIKGIHACHVTIGEVKEYVNKNQNYDTD